MNFLFRLFVILIGWVLSPAEILGQASFPPSILNIDSVVANVGDSVVVRPVISNSSGAVFQWKKVGVVIPGATGSTLNLVNIQPSDVGLYTFVASNSAGSSQATFTVKIATTAVFTTPPVGYTLEYGQILRLSAVAVAAPRPTFVWKKDGVPVANISEGIQSFAGDVHHLDMSISSYATPELSGVYTLTLTNMAGSVTSSGVVVTVSPARPPQIISQPSSRSVAVGEIVDFGVSIVATFGTITYQWTKDGVPFPGGFDSSIRLNSAQLSDSGSYQVIITGPGGSVKSNVASLIVGNTASRPVILTGPGGGYQSQTTTVGNAASFNVNAAGTAPLAYQWYKNGAVIPGATTKELILNPIVLGDAGTYYVVISNALGSVTSGTDSLSIFSPPAITTDLQSTAQTVALGGSVTFSLTASGSDLRYQWYRDNVAINGATSASLILVGVKPQDAGEYRVSVGNGLGTVFSRAAVLTVASAAPAIVTQPINQLVSVGAEAQFSVAVTGAAPLTFQWRKDGFAIPGATASSLRISSVQSDSVGSYSVAVANSEGSVVSASASLSIGVAATAPSIVTHPFARTLTVGSTTSLSVVATGSPAPTYQWSKSRVVIAGATASTYTIVSAQTTDTGDYEVVVSNAHGSVTSNVARVVVTAVPTAPTITTQPVNQSVTVGAGATFSVGFTGTNPFAFQWRKNGAAIAGATSANYTIASAQPSDAGTYSVVVANSIGEVTSAPATLVVTAPMVAPTIAVQPASQSVNVGTSVTFAVAASGSAPFTYQWSKDGAPISGANASTYSLTSAQTGDSGAYSVAVMNAAGSVTSSAAGLNVTLPTVAPTLTTQPSSQAVIAGSSATLSVSAAGTAPFTYQWFKGANPIGGATLSTYTIAAVQAGDAGSYTVLVANSAGSSTSSPAILSVVLPPTISTQPASQTIIAGGAATFSVMATGIAPLDYQWRKDGNAIAGATLSTYTITAVQPVDAGSYSVLVANSAGSSTSSAAILSVVVPPTISTQPASQTIIAGGAATLSVMATGTTPLSYQWRKDGNAISGATGPTYTLPAVRDTDAGNFSVVVTNAAGPITSSAAALTVVSFPGIYFGRFNNNPGDRFALVIRADGTAIFLGYAASLFTGYTATNIVVKPDGTFTADLTEIKPPAANTPAGDALPGAIYPPSLAAAPLTLSGSVASGQLTGGVTGAVLTLAAPKSPATGTAQSSAGVYQTSALNSSTGGLTTIVDATGAAFVFSQTTTGVAAGTGTLNTSTGQVIAMLADNSQATTTLNPGSGSATASVTTTSKETLSFAGLAEGTLRTDRLVNIASRGAVSASDLMIAGFVISGPSPKPVMIRATGPALAAFGLGGTLPNPKLELYRGTAKIQENDNWSSASNATEVVATAARTGAFPLTAASADAVLLTTLEPGGYTAQVSSVTGANGVALVEVYDAGSSAVTADTPRLINISTRANVAGGESLLIAGVVITGNSPKKILIRATGPALAAFGVPGALTDPLLKLYKGDAVLRQNDNWSDSATEAALIAAAGSATGAFALTPGTKDAALLMTLEPGAYTAQVSGVAGAAGAALVEVYEVP